MSLAVCETHPLSKAFAFDGAIGGARCGSIAFSPAAAAVDVASQDKRLAKQEEAIRKEAAKNKDGQIDIWNSIQSSKKDTDADLPAPYVHPLVRRSASSLSQKSLEICTESLGSETGSDGMFSSDDLEDYFSTCKAAAEDELVEETEVKGEPEQHEQEEEVEEHVEPTPPPPPPLHRRKKLESVNYHCSISSRSPPRSFPPPLPSICRRDGPCLSMRRQRRDGRLIVEAVAVPSQNYLHAQRQGGRLLLTFIETTFQDIYPENEKPVMELEQAEEPEVEADADETGVEDRVKVESAADDEAEGEFEGMGEEEGEEEVELVDKGIVVEVKVSSPPLPQSGGLKVQRSSVVINKFVSMPLSSHRPLTGQDTNAPSEGETAAATTVPPRPPELNNSTTTTATAVVAVAAAASSSLSTDERYWRNIKGPQSARRYPSPEKLFFTAKRLTSWQDLLHQVWRCSEHRGPLFIMEPCCIATS